MKLVCFNKKFKTTLDASEVFSENDLYWVNVLFRQNGRYEDNYWIVTNEDAD